MSWKWILLLTLFSHLKSSFSSNNACEVLHSPYENYVRCNGEFSNIESLKYNLKNITKNINTFELFNASIDALPDDIFQDVKGATIRKIIISHSSVEILNTPEYLVSPFKSAEDYLESFEVYDSSAIYAWNISALGPLAKLKTIIVENSDYISVQDTFRDFPNLRFVQLLSCSIRWLHAYVFRNNAKLTICSLANNDILELHRTMLPQPADYLWSLDLSFNKLKKLPEDMFIEMPFLHELKLDNNRLKSIKQHTFDPVWNQLSQLWIDGNGAICWSLCWISKRHYRPQFLESSKCHFDKSILLASFLEFCSH